MVSIKVENLTKDFTNNKNKATKLRVLDNVSIEINDGEFIAFFGPNGCGKTTLLNILSGIEKQTFGRILVNNEEPSMYKFGFVFQDYNESMLPWRTVLRNIELPLENKKISCSNKKKVMKLLVNTGLFEHKDKYFYELSGGLKQLVSICRAFVYDPDLFLMDEPFSSLDYSTSRRMWIKLLKIWNESKKTTLFVSHDVDEAIFLADRIVIFSKRPGKIKGIVEVDLPRPRKLNVLTSKKFFKIRNKILRLFESEN